MSDTLRATIKAIRRIAFYDAYPAALDAARGLQRRELEDAAAGESSDALCDATADACYGSPTLREWILPRARKIRHLFDLGDALEEEGLDVPPSKLQTDDLVDAIMWEIEHGPGEISLAWDGARNDAEMTAARDTLRAMSSVSAC